MGLSWHEKDYELMVLEMKQYLRDNYSESLDEAQIYCAVNGMINVMIDHGAVDPT